MIGYYSHRSPYSAQLYGIGYDGREGPLLAEVKRKFTLIKRTEDCGLCFLEDVYCVFDYRALIFLGLVAEKKYFKSYGEALKYLTTLETYGKKI